MSDEVNWQQLAEGFRLERNIMQEMAMKAREAGRREGLEEACAAECAWCKLGSAAVLRGGIWQHLEEHALAAGTCRAWRIRALIDSPKAENEKLWVKHFCEWPDGEQAMFYDFLAPLSEVEVERKESK